jgi:hypothetical protein
MNTFQTIIDDLVTKMATGDDYLQELLILKILLPKKIKETRQHVKVQRKQLSLLQDSLPIDQPSSNSEDKPARAKNPNRASSSSATDPEVN